MMNHTIVETILSARFFPELGQLASSELSVLALDTGQMHAVAASDPQSIFLVPVVRFETFMAKFAGFSGFDERDIIAQATRETAKIIAFFEDFQDQVKIIDVESMVELVASDDFRFPSRMPWLDHLKADVRAVVLPSALDRLLWLERRSDFGGEVERTFDALEACISALPSLDLECSRSEQPSGSLSRRYRLLSQIQRDLALPDPMELSGIELARLREENNTLQQSLEQATISQEINDLIIMQLQEELKQALWEQPADGDGHQDETVMSTVALDLASPPFRDAIQSPPSINATQRKPRPTNTTQKSLRHRIKRWALAWFTIPSTRAQIKLLKASDLFDSDWYCATYTDVADSRMSPEHHFLKFGAQEYRDPSPEFSTQRYLWQHPEIDAAKINPLVHFLRSASA